MADLLSHRLQGSRASRRKPRATATVNMLATLGLLKKTRNEDGFVIQGNNVIPELKSARVDAPAGIIAIFSTFSGMDIYEHDYYLGGVLSRKDLFVFDYMTKRYIETLGTGVGAWFTALIQDQPEDLVLEYLPYSNSTPATFLRNGSWANTTPGGDPGSGSFVYPDSWPLPCLTPHGILEAAWVALSGADIIYDNNYYSSMYNELSLIGYASDNSGIGERTLYSEQKIDPYNPASSVLFMPVTSGVMGISHVAGFRIPFSSTDETDRRFANIIKYEDTVYGYRTLLLSDILPDIADPPSTHTGDLMPAELRSIVLGDPSISGRMGVFHSFSAEADRSPVVFVSLDLTDAQSEPGRVGGPDANWLDDDANIDDRDWRISCHWLDTETGESWSFTAAQFWDLLRDRARNFSIDADWRTAPSNDTYKAGWYAALSVFDQFFGRPVHNFVVPWDTWTFSAEDGNIYAWTRYYGELRIERTGLVGLADGDIRVPAVVTDNDGVRPTIRYAGKFGESEIPRYLCVCEKLERATSSEDLPQGQKEILGIYVGTPFTDAPWQEFGDFSVESETETWALCHVRVAYHDFFEGDVSAESYDSVMMLGIARRRFIDEETLEEVIEYFSAVLMYNSLTGGEWSVVGKYPELDTIDPVYGERWSGDLCLFGDSILSPKMMKYISQPFSSSQLPYSPYDSYYSGLP
jgi:hypothetical protein